jgi:hypothetical protein
MEWHKVLMVHAIIFRVRQSLGKLSPYTWNFLLIWKLLTHRKQYPKFITTSKKCMPVHGNMNFSLLSERLRSLARAIGTSSAANGDHVLLN